jgi:hypothetical protein
MQKSCASHDMTLEVAAFLRKPAHTVDASNQALF